MNSSAPRTVKNQCLLFKPPHSIRFCYKSSKWLIWSPNTEEWHWGLFLTVHVSSSWVPVSSWAYIVCLVQLVLHTLFLMFAIGPSIINGLRENRLQSPGHENKRLDKHLLGFLTVSYEHYCNPHRKALSSSGRSSAEEKQHGHRHPRCCHSSSTTWQLKHPGQVAQFTDNYLHIEIKNKYISVLA